MDSDWRANFNTLQERNRYILENGLRADCCFLAGKGAKDQRLFNAHKLLLANASEVFDCMFFGSLPEQGDKPIEVTDIQANDFEKLLHFIYTDVIIFVAVDEAQRLYSAADKYMVNPLQKNCIKFLLENVKSENVCEIFEFSKKYDEKNLEKTCTDKIKNETAAVLASSSFVHADISTLDFILDQNNLNITSELQLFTALEKCANLRCTIDKRVDCKSICETCQQEKSYSTPSKKAKKRKVNVDLCQKIEVTDDFLKLLRKIRFLTLTVDEFLRGPANSKFISKNDALDMLRCIQDKSNIKNHFPIEFSVSQERRINPNIRNRGYGYCSY